MPERLVFSNGKAAKNFSQLINHFPNVKILVIGDWILDEFVWGTVERISPEAPVPVVNVIRESFVPGGALNVANNIRTLGGVVYPCGVVGRDLVGRMLVKAMKKEGIDTTGAIYDSNRPTTLKTRIIAHSQQVVRFDRENNQELSGELLKKVFAYIEKIISKVDAVIIEDYGKGMITPDLLMYVLKKAKAFKKPVLVDPKEKNFNYYQGVTVITPNRKEAFSAAGPFKDGYIPDIQEVGKALIKRFSCQAVLITLGEEGMMLFEKNGTVTKIPTAAREVFDVSGAGDTVIAVFTMALAAGANLKEAALVSNKAAGIVVAKLGTATVTPEELRQSVSDRPIPKKKSSKRILSRVPV